MIIEPTDAYRYLALARDRLFEWVRPLSASDYRREFPIGRRSLSRTLTHILASEWYYVLRIEGHDVPEYDRWPLVEEQAPPFAALVDAWSEQAGHTGAALAQVRNWRADLEYRVTDDDGQPTIVTTTRGDIFTQLVLHEVHHRAQAMSMLRHLGVAAEDLDYNALMFRRRRAQE
jgi:uncharacterized damage-inducible protein DinB